MKDLTLVIPAKHEKESLPTVMEELQKYNLKIIIVLEKTDHETIKSIEKFNCKVLIQKNTNYLITIIGYKSKKCIGDVKLWISNDKLSTYIFSENANL